MHCPTNLSSRIRRRNNGNGKMYKRTASYIFLPNSKPGTAISCPLNYFQDSCSISEKWIKNDHGHKMKLENLNQLSKVVITKKVDGVESEICLTESFSKRLFDYFNLDLSFYKGFDCYALQSLLSNVGMHLPSHPWDYEDISPSLGDIIVLSSNKDLAYSIKHWALSLGDDLYLSKFGRSGEGADAQVIIMNLEGMKLLYESSYCYIATPNTNAKIWDGYKYSNA